MLLDSFVHDLDSVGGEIEKRFSSRAALEIPLKFSLLYKAALKIA